MTLTDDRAAFEAVLATDPFDEFTRLVFADWLYDNEFRFESGHQRVLATAYATMKRLDLEPFYQDHDGPYTWDDRSDSDERKSGDAFYTDAEAQASATNESFEWWSHEYTGSLDSQIPLAVRLPSIWLMELNTPYAYANLSRDFLTREAAITAAADAFTRLEPELREKLSAMTSVADFMTAFPRPKDPS